MSSEENIWRTWAIGFILEESEIILDMIRRLKSKFDANSVLKDSDIQDIVSISNNLLESKKLINDIAPECQRHELQKFVINPKKSLVGQLYTTIDDLLKIAPTITLIEPDIEESSANHE